MEGVIIDYHLLFLVMAFSLFLIEMFLLFILPKPTQETAIAAIILSGFNMNLCWISSFSFFAINIPGISSTGALVNNPTADMYMFFAIFLGLFFVNVGLLFYSNFQLYKIKALMKPKVIDKQWNR
jgi:hypothetical protein